MSLGRRTGALLLMATTAGFGVLIATAQGTPAKGAQQPNFTLPAGGFNNYQVPALPVAKPITSNGTVVEDVVVRINDMTALRCAKSVMTTTLVA